MIFASDNIRITKSSIQRSIETMNATPIQDMALKLVAAGVDAIDINPGPLSSIPEEKMKFIVRSVQDITDLPIILDTSNPVAIRAGLRESINKVIINGFSLEPDKLKKILPLASEFDAVIIGYLLGPDGQPPSDIQDRLSIAIELFQKCKEYGVSENRLIIDPVVAPVLWNDGASRNMGLLEVIRLLPDVLGFPVQTIAGLSNLTSGIKDMEKKLILQKTYLPMLSASGVSIVLMNVLNKPLVQFAKACDSLTSKKPFSLLEL